MTHSRTTRTSPLQAVIGAVLLISLSQPAVTKDDKAEAALTTAKQDVKEVQEVVVRDAKIVGETVKRDTKAAVQVVKKDAKAVETVVVQDATKAKAALKKDK